MDENPVTNGHATKPPLFANRPFVIGLLYLIGPWTVVSFFMGVTLAYIMRSKPHEAWEASHFQYLITTFWIGFLAALILIPAMVMATIETGAPFWMFGFGLFLLLIMVFTLVRAVLSMMKASEAKPIPNPGSLLFGQ